MRSARGGVARPDRMTCWLRILAVRRGGVAGPGWRCSARGRRTDERVVVGRPAGVPECSGGPGAEAVAHYPFVGTPSAADARVPGVRTPSGERGHEIACPQSPYGVRGSGHRRRETGSPAIRTMPGRSRGLGHLLGTGDVQYQVPAHQYLSRAPTIARLKPRHPAIRAEPTTCGRTGLGSERDHSGELLRDSCVLLGGVVGVKGRRSRRDAEGAVDARRPDQHTHAARSRAPTARRVTGRRSRGAGAHPTAGDAVEALL